MCQDKAVKAIANAGNPLRILVQSLQKVRGWVLYRENLNKRKWQLDSTPIVKYYFTWSTLVLLKISTIMDLYRGPLYIGHHFYIVTSEYTIRFE